MSLGPYASFIVTSYAAAAIVVAILIGWVVLDYRNQTRRLRELDRSGITRRSGRSATDTP
jgi:heme exporter protein D